MLRGVRDSDVIDSKAHYGKLVCSALFVVLLVAVGCVVAVASIARASGQQVASSAPRSLPLTGNSRPLAFGGVAARSTFAAVDDLRNFNGDTIAICHPDWHGIRQAAYALGDPILEVPGIQNADHEAQLISYLRDLATNRGLRNVVVHGIPPRTPAFARALHAAQPNLRISFVYHGAPSNAFHEYEAHLLDELVDGVRAGYIYRLGMLKSGFAPILAGFNVSVHTLWNAPALHPRLPVTKLSAADGKVHIGVMATGTSAKNVLTMLVSLCAERDTVVHVVKLPGNVRYLNKCAASFVEHGFLPHDPFMDLIAAMDVNLYVSLSECFPMGVLESLSVSVPCLTSDTSAIYAVDPVLHADLVVPQFDNPYALQQHVHHVLDKLRADRNAYSLRLKGLTEWLTLKARLEWDRFLDRTPNRDPASEAAGESAPQLPPPAAVPEDEETSLVTAHIRASKQRSKQAAKGKADTSRSRSSRAQLRKQQLQHKQQAEEEADAAAAAVPTADLALFGLPDPRLPYTPWTPLPPPLPRAAAASAAAARGGGSGSLTIALATYELAPVTFGGAGTVVSALALQLLSAGHRVVLAAYFDAKLLDEWAAYAAEQLQVRPDDLRDRLTVIHLPTVVAAHAAEVKRSADIYLQRSREFAVALKYVYADTPFDVLELFDYAGIGFELLRARRVAAQQAVLQAAADSGSGSGSGSNNDVVVPWYRGDRVPLSGPHHSGSDSDSPYLPTSVPIALRLHGSLELLDHAEGAHRTTAPLYALLERYCLETADMLYVQSRAMADVYARAYTLDASRFVLAPPPMGQMLASLGDRSLLSVRPSPDVRQLAWLPDADPLKPRLQGLLQECEPWRGCKVLLVLGKLQKVKGSLVVAQAAVRLFQRLRQDPETAAAAAGDGGSGNSGRRSLRQPDGKHVPNVMVAFVGIDTPCPEHDQDMSACVTEELAALPLAAERSRYLGPVSRAALPQLLQVLNPRAGVIASSFETFNMAAHELSYFNIPLVLSSIPAFREFFVNVSAADSDSSSSSKRSAFLFTPGDAADCARALYAAVSDDAAVADIRASPPLQYSNAVSAYSYVPAREADEEEGEGEGQGTAAAAALGGRRFALLEGELEPAIRVADGEPRWLL